MRQLLTGSALVGLMTMATQGAIIARWTFESLTIPANTSSQTYGPIAADVGSGSALGYRLNGTATWSSPVGNGSSRSFSSNTWHATNNIGSGYEFQISTIGYSAPLFLSFDQTRSSTGPASFEVVYSTDGVTWTQLTTYTVPVITWSSTPPPSQGSTFGPYLLPAGLANQPTVYIRLRNTAVASASAGTSRVDNVTISSGELPAPANQVIYVNGGTSPSPIDITLSDTYTGIITSLTSPNYPTLTGTGGTLKDPSNNGDITSTPYTLLNDGKVVRFAPHANASGWYKFTYRVTDGQGNFSLTDTTVNLFIQGHGQVVITEIMYAPANRNFDDPNFDSDWEWIEIRNLTGNNIVLGTLYDNVLTTTDNLNGYVLPANSVRVLSKPDRGSFSLAQFETEWNIIGQNIVIQMLAVAQSGEPRLANAGDNLLLFAADGSLLDRVAYSNGSGWPTANGKASIYLKFDKQDTFANDLGSNWQRSVAGYCGAWATPQNDESPAPPVDDSDVGSPGVLPTQICNAAPVATDGQINVPKDASPGYILPLTATDEDGNPLVFTIVTLPASGTLTDPNSGEAAVSPGGSLAGATVRYTPAPGYTGTVFFTFKANDGTVDSNVATYTIQVVPPTSASPVRINEVYLNNAGPDVIEFYELHGPPGTSLNTMTIVEIDGDGSVAGRINKVIPLTGRSIPADGLFVVGVSGTPNVDLDLGPIGGGQIQNGTGTFVLVENYSPVPDGDVDTNNDGVPEYLVGSLIDAVGVSDEEPNYRVYYGAPFLGRTPGGKSPAGIARLCDGVDTDTAADWTYTSEDTYPPATGTGVDGYVAASPGESNNPLYGGNCAPVGQNPVVTAAVSRKVHGTAGPFNINLLAASPVEHRTGGPTILVVTFDVNIQTTMGNASVTLSSGTVTSLVVAGNQLTVNMTGATNGQPLIVAFPGVADAVNPTKTSASTLCFGVRAGDVNGDRNVNIFDLVQVRNVLGAALTLSNFRADVTADGTINIFDLVGTRNNLGGTVAPCTP